MKNIQFKNLGKWLKRQIVWLLVVTLSANVLNILVAPRVARAADPNMMLFWDGAGAPAGWSFVDDNAGEAFYNDGAKNLFPRGNSSFGQMAGGADNHTHTGTADANSSGATGSNATTTAAAATVVNLSHVHPSAGSASLTSTSNLPVYRNLRVIQSSGIPTTIPSGAIAIFDSAVADQMPNADWDSYSTTEGTNFIAGFNASGGTGGNNTHGGAGHTVSGLTLNQSVSPAYLTLSGTTSARNTINTHTHTACNTNNVTSTPNTEPPYVNVLLGKTNKDTGVPAGMIAMFDGSVAGPSYGWQVLSNAGGPFYQKFLKSATTYSAGPAWTEHTHTKVTCTSTSVGADQKGGTSTSGFRSHTHTLGVTINAASGTTLPPYTDVIFARKSYEFTTLTTDNGIYDTSGSTITINATVTNNSTSNLTGTDIDYVIFVDGNANNIPDAGETYVYDGGAACDSSGAFGSVGPGYTFRKTALDVNSGGGTGNDSQNCTNTNFPQHTDYVLYSKWFDGGTTVYASKYVSFHSVPTLTEILFMALVGSAVFLGVRSGVIKLKIDRPDDSSGNTPPPTPHGEPLDSRSGFRASPSRSNDGIAYIREKNE